MGLGDISAIAALKRRASSEAGGGGSSAPSSRYDPASMDRIGRDEDVDDEDDRIDQDPEINDFPADAEYYDGQQYGDGDGRDDGHSFDDDYYDGIDIAEMRKGGMTPFDRRVRRTILCVSVLAVIAGTSAGIALKLQEEESSSRGGGSGGGAAAKHAAIGSLTAPPKDLSRKCSPVSVSSSERGFERCKKMCEPAECCMLPVGHWFSCQAGNEVMCSAYEYSCRTLDQVEKKQQGGGGGDSAGAAAGVSTISPDTVEIPPAPPDLVTTCSASNLADIAGYEACRHVCDAGICCPGLAANFAEGEECRPSDPTVCGGYDSCDILTRATPASHPDAVSSEAKKKCNTQALATEVGVVECEDFCEPAICCFVDGANVGPKDCADHRGSEGWCGQYGPCQALVHMMDGAKEAGGGGHGGLDDAAAEATVQEACSMGFAECANICSAAECCFVSGPDGCASHGLGEIDCSHYQSCDTLYLSEVDVDVEHGVMNANVPVPPEDLNLLCSSPRNEDVTRCYNTCKTAHCCSEAIEVCRVTDPLACEGYTEPCDLSWNDMAEEVVIAPAPVEVLAASCFSGPGTPQLSTECQDACSAAECCHADADECVVYNEDACGGWSEYCTVAWDPDGAFRLEGPESSVGDLCSDDDANSSAECLDACSASVCCGSKTPCAKTVVTKEVCDEYDVAGCGPAWEVFAGGLGGAAGDGIIDGARIPNEAPGNLDNLCASSDSAKQKQCDDACALATCCHAKEKGCVESNRCDAYFGPCEDFVSKSWHGATHEIKIRPDPEGMGWYCGNGPGQTISDKAKCKDLCDAAECCHEHDLGTEAVDCESLVNPEACGPYRDHCHLLWEGIVAIEIPPPPTNLAQACSPLSLSTGMGRMACRDACLPASCCADDEHGCEEGKYSNRAVCNEYTPCTMLYVDAAEGDMAVTIPVPPSNLADICSAESLSTAGGHDHCNATCSEARCCNLPIEQCRVHNPHVCQQYSPCEVLYTKGANKYAGFVEIPPAPSDIDSFCSADSLVTVQGFTHCEDVCDRGRCCEETAEECGAKNPAVCDGYYPCSFLFVDGGAFDDTDQDTLVELTEEVNRACSPSALFHPQGLSACQHVCNDRLCCFEKEEEFSCKEKKECAVFSACQNLLDYGYVDGDGTAAKDDGDNTDSQVNNLCTTEALKQVSGINSCWKACSPYLCCFADHEEENCYADQQDICDKYSACALVVEPFEEGSAAMITDTANRDDITKEIIGEACSLGSLDTKAGLSNCHKLCGPHLCCFVPLGQQSNCVDTQGSQCLIYGACSVLADYEDDVVSIGYDENELNEDVCLMEEFCTPKSFAVSEDNKLRCVDVCSRRACCFTEGRGSCQETDRDWCDEFRGCSIAHDYVPDDEEQALSTRAGIKKMCKPDILQSSVGLNACRDICEPHKCCWQKTADCGTAHEDSDCDIYDGCQYLADFLAEQEKRVPETICSQDAISTADGRSACQEMCDERGCCWVKTAHGNCYEYCADWCDEYKQCLILDAPPHQDQPKSTEEEHPDQLCTVDKVSTLDGRDICQNRCDERACCWAGDCMERKPGWCGEYRACLILGDDESEKQGPGGNTNAQNDTSQQKAVTGNTVAQPESDLDEICSAATIEEDGGAACKRACKPRSCCFAKDALYNCRNEQSAVCIEFDACKTLFESQEG